MDHGDFLVENAILPNDRCEPLFGNFGRGRNEQFIQHELESGVYQSRGELLDQAVRLLKRRRELQREIHAGMDSGPGIPAREVFARLEQKARQLANRDVP